MAHGTIFNIFSYNGKESEKRIYAYTAESLCCMPEIL